jgi:hypothetical protein
MTLRGMLTISIVSVAVAVGVACGPDQRIIESGNTNANRADASDSPAVDLATPSLEQDLEAMRNADFYFIYVFRRKDGQVLDADDKRFMAAVIPTEINRRTISDGGRALICGSNFRIPPEAWEDMKMRFDFEDYSRPESEIMGANASPAR